VFLRQLWLQDFRNYQECECEFSTEGLTVVRGANGQGKTNFLEAIGYVATTRSFRGAMPEVLISNDAESSVIRGLGERSGRELLIESELRAGRRGRTLVNKQSLRKTDELQDLLAVTVFSPDDLSIVKGGPALRRQFVDELLADGDRSMRALRQDYERVIKQRNTLLRQSGGRLTPDVALTLDVWDSKMTELGEALGEARQRIVEELQPQVAGAYSDLAGETAESRVGMRMESEWREEDGGKGLAESLAASRKSDLARQVTTVGPHRDDLNLTIAGMPARTHASQGEQRTLTLALRLASHRFLTEKAGSPPILLLDDVFSELDDARSHRLVAELPVCQTFLSTATAAPNDLSPAGFVNVSNGVATS
jgi:DNA replication and repair protein RecF